MFINEGKFQLLNKLQKNFDLEIRHRSFLNEGIIRLFDALPDGAHPMATMGAATMALSAFYKDHLHLEDEEEFKMMRRRILARACYCCNGL